jgi:DinB superfamily
VRTPPLKDSLLEHRAAVDLFSRTARHLSADDWVRPVAPGKWSPAQITEHVALAIELFTDELAGRPGVVPRLSRWRRLLLRISVMPALLRSGRFPNGARAPRQFRPSIHLAAQDEGITRLEDAARALDATAAALPEIAGRKVTHPYFGPVRAPVALWLLTLHARHHLEQLTPRRTA